MNKCWRKVRVVVEVTVRGELTDRDLRWLVERSLEEVRMDAIMRARLKDVAQFGRTEVKSYSKVIEAERRTGDKILAKTLRHPERFISARTYINRIRDQFDKLEKIIK